MRKKSEKPVSSPIVRVRIMIIGVAAIIALISGPLLAVWKQVYINNTSIKLSKMTDRLSSLRKEIATLQFTCERYASTERIEKIANEKLNLEYPVSNQIVIIHLQKQNSPKLSNAPKEFLVYLKKAIAGDRG
jgi:cell division protein FtsL